MDMLSAGAVVSCDVSAIDAMLALSLVVTVLVFIPQAERARANSRRRSGMADPMRRRLMMLMAGCGIR
jgi:hypothetical protein